MYKIASFEKVSENEYYGAFDMNVDHPADYGEIKLPQRATKGSAGYDFYSTVDFSLLPGETIKIPTGIRAKIDEGWVLMLYPRSGLGFKYRLQLNNTVGIIDSDYYYSDNQGHIYIKITNCTNENKVLNIKKGEAFAQGVFTPFGVTKDDYVSTQRNGGFGSTDNK